MATIERPKMVWDGEASQWKAELGGIGNPTLRCNTRAGLAKAIEWFENNSPAYRRIRERTMEDHKLAELAAKMRHAQKEYFRTRSSTALNESKRLEKQFDAALEAYLLDQRQPSLFGEEQ